MKKISYIFILLITVLGFTSCFGGQTQRVIVRDNPTAEITELLKLNDVKAGASLNPTVDKTIAYTDVVIANDAKSTLVYDVIDMDEYLSTSLKSVAVNVLYFNGSIPGNDATLFMTVMNDSNNGLTSSRLNYNFNVLENYSKTLFGELAISHNVDIPAEYKVKNNDPSKLVVAYLPTYCIYNDGTQDYTKVFLLVPVFYALAYESNLDTFIDGLTYFKVTLDDAGLLPHTTE